jgi:hypothetical protein
MHRKLEELQSRFNAMVAVMSEGAVVRAPYYIPSFNTSPGEI